MYISSVFRMSLGGAGGNQPLFMVYKLFHSTLIFNTICKIKSIHTYSPHSSTSHAILCFLYMLVYYSVYLLYLCDKHKLLIDSFILFHVIILGKSAECVDAK